jgi:hypothetical protein
MTGILLRNSPQKSIEMSFFTGKRRSVCGVDFSGARDAGRRIWIARCKIGEDAVNLLDLLPAESLPGSGRARELSYRALASCIGKQKDAVFGLDFPFSLPGGLIRAKTWKEFVLTFEETYKGPEDFRKLCRSGAKGRDLKRRTDMVSRAPFSPYNLRLFRQTYFGIKDVLTALVRTGAACILPMQQPLHGKAWVVEICPASTLKKENLRMPYKGRGNNRMAARRKILEALEENLQLRVVTPAIRSKIISEIGGDALDSVIAAVATFNAQRNSFLLDTSSPYDREGWVYV